MLPEAIEVSILTSVDAFSVVLVTEVGIFVTANVAVLLADPVAVDMLVVWLGVVTLDVDIVNSEAVVLRTDGMSSEFCSCIVTTKNKRKYLLNGPKYKIHNKTRQVVSYLDSLLLLLMSLSSP